MKKLFIVFVLMFSILYADIDEAIKIYYAKDFKKVLPMFEQLQKDGNIESNYYLGTMYYSARGVKQDYKKAFEYYTLASSLPNKKRLESILNLANMYTQGQGVKKDEQKAFTLLKILDEKNIGLAQLVMGSMYEGGNGVQKDLKKAIFYYEKGCNTKKTYPKACYFAGDYYENGVAVEKNYETAKKYYEKGCEGGVEESCEAIKNMKEPLSFYQKYFWHMIIIGNMIALLRIWKHKKEKKGYWKNRKN